MSSSHTNFCNIVSQMLYASNVDNGQLKKSSMIPNIQPTGRTVVPYIDLTEEPFGPCGTSVRESYVS